MVASNNAAPDFFAKNGYKPPTDSLNTIVQHYHGGKGETHVIQHYARNNLTQGFADMMETWHLGRPYWSDEDFYPVRERLVEGAKGDDSSVFMVDVGGSQGNDLTKFLERHPYNTFPGHLVVQDTPGTINAIPDGKLDKGIQATVHDFLEPQPVQGKVLLEAMLPLTIDRGETVLSAQHHPRQRRCSRQNHPEAPGRSHEEGVLQVDNLGPSVAS